jgi:hypothetical protein
MRAAVMRRLLIEMGRQPRAISLLKRQASKSDTRATVVRRRFARMRRRSGLLVLPSMRCNSNSFAKL